MGWFSERLGGAVSDAITSFFVTQTEQAIEWLAEVITNIFAMAQTVLDMPIVVQGIGYAQGVAFTLLAVKVAWDAFHIWILYSNGDPEADPKGLLIGTCKAVAIIGCLPWGVKYMYQIGSEMAMEVSQLSGVGEVNFTNLFAVMISSGSILLAIAVLIAAVLIIIIFIQTFIRAATLGLLAVIGPVIAVQQVGGGQLFNMWLKELMVVCFSQAIQIFMLLAAAYAFAGIALENVFISGLMLLGWLWATVKAPGTLKQMLYSSGAGSAAGSAAQTAGTMLIVRKMMTRGV